MTEQIKILYIDDNPLDRALVRDSLEKAHGGFEVTEAKSKVEFEEYLNNKIFDLVLTDFNILGFTGLQVLEMVLEKSSSTPVIIVTGTGSEEVAVEAMRGGASDYVIKTPSHISRLPGTILSALERKKIIDERKKAEGELSRMNRVYALVSNINKMLVRKPDKEKLFSEVCNIAISYGQFDMAWIALMEEKYTLVKPKQLSDKGSVFLSKLENLINDKSVSEDYSCRFQSMTEDIFICNDIEECEDFISLKNEVIKIGYRSFISLPFKLNNKVLGSFNLFSSEIDFFDDKEVELLSGVTKDISFSLDIIQSEEKRILAEKALQESENKFRLIAENANDLIYTFKFLPKPIFEYVSPSSLRITGYTPEEYYNDPGLGLKLLIPEDRKKLNDLLNTAIKSDPIELRWIKKNKDVIWCDQTSVPIKDENGINVGFYAIARDITESKLATNLLRESEEKYSLAFNTSPYAITITSVTNGKIIEVNDSFTKISGFNRVEAIGKTVIDLNIWVDKNARDKIEVKDKEVNFRRKNGEIYSALISSKIISLKNNNYILASINDISESKRIESALRKAEKRLGYHIANSPLAVIECDANSTITMWDGNAEKIFGWTKEETLGKAIDDLKMIYNEDISAVEITRKKLSDGKTIHVITSNRNYTKDGRIIFCDWYNSVLYDENGKIISIMSQVLDTTKNKVAEIALKDSEEKYRKLVELSPDSILIHVNGKIQYANNAAVILFDAKEKEVLIGKNIIDFVHPEYKGIVKERISKVIDEKKRVPSIEEKLIKVSGEEFYAEVTAIPITISGDKGIQVITRDITERKEAEESLKKLSVAIEQSPVSIVITDTLGKIEYGNPKVSKITGYDINELVGKNPRIFKSGEMSTKEYRDLWSTISSGKVWSGELHNRKKNGELYWENATISPIINKSGEITHYIAIKEDITERKQSAEELKKYRENLEELVRERTLELEGKNKELENFNNLFIGREFRIKELRDKVKELESKLNINR